LFLLLNIPDSDHSPLVESFVNGNEPGLKTIDLKDTNEITWVFFSGEKSEMNIQQSISSELGKQLEYLKINELICDFPTSPTANIWPF